MWNPNEENNYAWLSCQAKEHGGVESLINDIREEGFVDGVEEGRIEGGIIGGLAVLTGFGICCIAKKIYESVQSKKQITENAEKAKSELKRIYEKNNADNDNASNSDNN